MHVTLQVFDFDDLGDEGTFSPKLFRTDTIAFAEPHPSDPNKCFIHVDAAPYLTVDGPTCFCVDHSLEEVALQLGAEPDGPANSSTSPSEPRTTP